MLRPGDVARDQDRPLPESPPVMTATTSTLSCPVPRLVSSPRSGFGVIADWVPGTSCWAGWLTGCSSRRGRALRYPVPAHSNPSRPVPVWSGPWTPQPAPTSDSSVAREPRSCSEANVWR